MPGQPPPPVHYPSKIWIFEAMCASVFFTIANIFINQINIDVGPQATMYFAFGFLLTSVVVYTIHGVKNEKNKTGLSKYWIDLGVVEDGVVNMKKVVGLIGFALLFQIIQNLAMVSLYLAQLADMNTGIIATIWAINPLFSAIMDALVFKQKLKNFHYIGMIGMVCCSCMISLRDLIYPPAKNPSASSSRAVLASWIPVIGGLITTCSFTANQMLCKHFLRNRIFSLKDISYSHRQF